MWPADKLWAVLSSGRCVSFLVSSTPELLKQSADKCQPPVLSPGCIDSPILFGLPKLKALSFIISSSFDTPTDVSTLNAEPFWCGLNKTYLWSGCRLHHLCNSNLDINISMSQLNFLWNGDRVSFCISWPDRRLSEVSHMLWMSQIKGLNRGTRNQSASLPPGCKAIIDPAPRSCTLLLGQVPVGKMCTGNLLFALRSLSQIKHHNQSHQT